MAIMNVLNGKNTVLDFFKDAINKKEYARAYYILTLILLTFTGEILKKEHIV